MSYTYATKAIMVPTESRVRITTCDRCPESLEVPDDGRTHALPDGWVTFARGGVGGYDSLKHACPACSATVLREFKP